MSGVLKMEAARVLIAHESDTEDEDGDVSPEQ